MLGTREIFATFVPEIIPGLERTCLLQTRDLTGGRKKLFSAISKEESI